MAALIHALTAWGSLTADTIETKSPKRVIRNVMTGPMVFMAPALGGFACQ